MTPPNGTSGVEELRRHLAEHVSSESDLIAKYRELATAPDTPAAARYLIDLVVEDEERHHRLLEEIVTTLANDFGWYHEPGELPDLPDGPPSQALEEATSQFLDAELTDQEQLRVLSEELRASRDTSLSPLLVELMEHDTAKHIVLLTFIRDHVARRATT